MIILFILIEETIYWLNLLIDSPLPICGNAGREW